MITALSEEYRQVRQDGTCYIVRHLVRHADDLAILTYIFEDEEYSINREEAGKINEIKKIIGDRSIL